jgi:hypothetical protein
MSPRLRLLVLVLMLSSPWSVCALEEWPFATVVFVDVPLDGEFGHVFLHDGNSDLDIVGSTNNGFTEEPFLLQHPLTVMPLACPGGLAHVEAINRWGHVGGYCTVSGATRQGFIWNPSRWPNPFIFLAVPQQGDTYVYGLNDWGQVVGIYYDAQGGGPHAYFAANGQYLPFTLAPNGEFGATPLAIANTGAIVGIYTGADRHRHGVLYYYGLSQTFDVPGAFSTALFDINDHWQVVGVYAGQDGSQSFLYDNGEFFDLTVPAPDILFTDVSAITNQGHIVGRVLMPDPTDPNERLSRGFVSTLGPRPTAGSVAALRPARQTLRDARGVHAVRLVLDPCAEEEGGVIVPAKLQGVGCQR